MKLDAIMFDNCDGISFSDLKIFYNADIYMNDLFSNMILSCRIGGFKVRGYLYDNTPFLLLLIRGRKDVDMEKSYYYRRGVYSLNSLMRYYQRGIKNNIYYITNDFQNYDYYMWLPYRKFLEIRSTLWANRDGSVMFDF